MKQVSILSICILFFGLSCFAQQTIIGRWKPTYFSMGGLVTGDLINDNEPHIKMDLDSLVKNDKDPGQSKQMMQQIFQLTFDKTKGKVLEFFANNTYKETDTQTGKTKTGIYVFNEAIKKLSFMQDNTNYSKQFFAEISNNNELLLESELENDKAKSTLVEKFIKL